MQQALSFGIDKQVMQSVVHQGLEGQVRAGGGRGGNAGGIGHVQRQDAQILPRRQLRQYRSGPKRPRRRWMLSVP